MTQEVEAPTLYPEIQTVAPPPGRGKHGYYRKTNGWVVVAATTPSNRSDYEYKGFTFLARYGEFINGTGIPRADQNERDARGTPWNPAVEPWRLIFQKDGAKEFPVDQIIAYRWHIRPPYREVKFPQLQGREITNYGCPECTKGVFASENPAEAAIMLRTHLTSAISDSHKYTATDLKTLGTEWEIDFESQRLGRRHVTIEDAPSIEEADKVVELTVAEKDYKCQNCGYEPTEGNSRPWLALRNHKCQLPVEGAPERSD